MTEEKKEQEKNKETKHPYSPVATPTLYRAFR